MLGTNELYDIVREGLRVLFLLGLPILLGVGTASILVGVLQAATTIKDSAISYAAKICAFFAMLYLLAGEIERSFTELALQAFR